mgnify:CR=1 FL=1
MKRTPLFILFLLAVLTKPSFGQDSMALYENSDLWNISLDELVVTAQHEPTHYKNAVHPVHVIDGKTIEKLGMANLAEVLGTQLNMQVTTDLILGSGLTMQGISGENIQIMIDGVPVIGRLDGNIDLSQIQMNNVRRIEVIEGTMSAQFGSNATGGVINIITQASQVPKFQISTQNRAESKGILDNSLSTGLRLGSFFLQGNVRRNHVRLNNVDSLRLMEQVILDDGTKFRTKKYPWNPKLQHSADASLKYQLNDSISFRYSYRFFDEDVIRYGELRRPQFKPYAFDDRYNTRRSDHALIAKGYLGERLYFTSTQAINNYDRTLLTERFNMEENERIQVDDSQDSTYYKNILSRNMISYVTPINLDIQAGIEWQRESADGSRFATPESGENLTSITNTAGWLSLKYELIPSLTLLGNLRYGHNTRFDHPVLPSVQTLWKPWKNWSIRAGYSHGFRAPSLKEMVFEFIDINHYILGNEDLVAETSSNYTFDLSFESTIAGSKLKTNIGLFSHQIKDRIILAEYETLKYTYQNIENFKTRGFDISLEYPFTSNLRLRSSGGITYLSNVFSENYETDPFFNVYEFQNTLEFYWPWSKTDLQISQKYTSKQQQFHLNDQGELVEGYLNGYNMLHASMTRSFFNNNLSLSFGVKNLLNVSSIGIQGGNSIDGGAHSNVGNSRLVHWGRSFFVGLNYTFSR